MEGNILKFKITCIVNEHITIFLKIYKSQNFLNFADQINGLYRPCCNKISWIHCETISFSCTGKLPQGTMMGTWLCHNDLVTFTDKYCKILTCFIIYDGQWFWFFGPAGLVLFIFFTDNPMCQTLTSQY